MADRIGQRVGDYRLIRSLGEGTFGDVYLGEHVYQKTPVAVKVFKAKLTPGKLKDFINEVRTVLLRHPNISQILDFGIDKDDISFLVMELAPKGTLIQQHPRGTVLPLATIITYVKQIAAALQYAHGQRRIHRDVKPENMLIGANNEILLSDFGIAVVAHSPHSQKTEDALGTAIYMAPEQWQGKPLPATDQYALGIIVYEWLCGECPFKGNMLQLMYQHINVSPPPLHDKIPTISPEVEQVVMKALAKKPEDRHHTVLDFANALEKALKHPSLILLNHFKLEGDTIVQFVWSPNGKYIGIMGKKTVHIFEAYNGKRVFVCDHKISSIGRFNLLWNTKQKAENLHIKTITYSHEGEGGDGYLIDNFTGETILKLYGDHIVVGDGRFFPDKSQPEYWNGKFVESLIALTEVESFPPLPISLFYHSCCLWSPNLKHIAIHKAQNIEIYKIIAN